MSRLNIYVASSWRNARQPALVERLRDEGFGVYDFRHPFQLKVTRFSDIDPGWQTWSSEQFLAGLRQGDMVETYNADMAALDACDVCVLLAPSGRSAHLEAGYARGKGKYLFILLEGSTPQEPELLYSLADALVLDEGDLLAKLSDIQGDLDGPFVVDYHHICDSEPTCLCRGALLSASDIPDDDGECCCVPFNPGTRTTRCRDCDAPMHAIHMETGEQLGPNEVSSYREWKPGQHRTL